MNFEITLDYYSFNLLNHHTCKFELFTLLPLLRNGCSNFSPIVSHIKFMKVPKLMLPFLLYDINADEDHYIFVNSTLCSTEMAYWSSLKQLYSKITVTEEVTQVLIE